MNKTAMITALVRHYTKGNKSQFANMLGVSAQTVSAWISRNTFDSELVYAKCIGLSPEWLLTGKGDMIKSSTLDAAEPLITTPDIVEMPTAYQCSTPSTTTFPSLTDVTVNNQRIPLYNIDAAAGLVSLFNETPNHILDYISIPNLPKVDSAVYVRGDSMYPILKSGDIILVKQIHNIDYILFGEMHLLSFSADDDEYICVKFVQRSDDKNYVKLVSQNTHHPDQLIPINSIRAIAIVKASIRYNTMG